MDLSKKSIDIIGERLAKLDEAIFELEKTVKEYSLDKFIKETKIQHATIYELILGIEAICDIGGHILSYYFGRKSDTYKDIMKQLAETEVIPTSLYIKSEKMPDFRNLAIHVYLKIDEEMVYRDLPVSIKHFREYAKHFFKFIDEKSS